VRDGNDILASFGMWLARRFGGVRPGGGFIPKGSTLHVDIVDNSPTEAKQKA
jgi:hypothetical protein